MPSLFFPQLRCRSVNCVLTILILFEAALSAPPLNAGQAQAPRPASSAAFVQSIVVGDKKIDTKSYLDQAWELKVRGGLTANSGLVWDSAAREWRLKSRLPEEAEKAIAHYASWTAIAARVGINTAQAYRELDRIDELAKFYDAFLKTYFTTLGELRKINGPEIKQKLLGSELGPDAARTLAWYWKQSDGSIILRECYLYNADYFYPSARLVRTIAALKPKERTSAMSQFVSDYVPLLVKEHILRPNFAERMRGEMNPSSPTFKKQIMIGDEIRCSHGRGNAGRSGLRFKTRWHR
jgi:hypothetical protein